MKKFLVVTALFALSSTSAFAIALTPSTGTLLLQGIVNKKVSITVTAQSAASSLNLETSQTNLKVATVNEKSNSKTGYKVTITSANLGKLKRTDGPEVFNYTLKYGGQAVALTTASGSEFNNPSSSSVNVNKDLEISYTGVANENMVEGSYADTLTLNIAAN